MSSSAYSDELVRVEEVNTRLHIGRTNKHTARKTKQDLSMLRKFLSLKSESRTIENIPAEQLSAFLTEFITTVKMKNGNEFEPASLRAIIASIERYLKETNYGVSVVTDRAFAGTRAALRAKQKQLQQLGKGCKPHAAQALTDHEVNALWERGAFGVATPDALINTLWFNHCMLGVKTASEHHELKWGDIVLKSFYNDGQECEYLEHTKSRDRQNRGIFTSPRLEAIPNSIRCPVNVYKVYRSRRPADTLYPGAPFYLCISRLRGCWFKSYGLGLNKIGTLMKMMLEKAGLELQKRITNASARKTLEQRMNYGIPPSQVMAGSSRSLQNVIRFIDLPESQQKDISCILAGAGMAAGLQESTSLSQPGNVNGAQSLATSNFITNL